MPHFAALDDVDSVRKDLAGVEALRRYVTDRVQRDELAAARIVGELRIGELLGVGVVGRPKAGGAAGLGITEDDRKRFRKLAAHRDEVLAYLSDGVRSRESILEHLDHPASVVDQDVGIEDDDGFPPGDCAGCEIHCPQRKYRRKGSTE